MKSIIVGLFVALALVATGCSQHLGNFSALSTGTYDGKQINKSHLVKKNAKGGSKSLILLGIPLGGLPKVDQAVSEALSQADGDFMQNARLYSYGWTALLVGETGYTVEGDVYKTGE